MIELSEATAIAIHAMIYIVNKKDKVITLKEISEHFNVSSNHLSKVLQRLVKAGYLISIKGPKGGFQINMGKNDATLLDIYEVIEGKFSPKSCLFSSKKINSCCCIMRPLLTSINNTFIDFMSKHKISNIKL